jgi:hypothetical protein
MPPGLRGRTSTASPACAKSRPPSDAFSWLSRVFQTFLLEIRSVQSRVGGRAPMSGAPSFHPFHLLPREVLSDSCFGGSGGGCPGAACGAPPAPAGAVPGDATVPSRRPADASATACAYSAASTRVRVL